MKCSSGATLADQDWPIESDLTVCSDGRRQCLPADSFSDGYTTWADDSKNVGKQANNVYQIADNFTHVSGKHTLKFGGDYRWMQTNGADFFLSAGQLCVPFAGDGISNRRGPRHSGNGFASFLLGAVDNARYNVLAVVPGNRYRYFATYFQDDWKVSSRLTLNLGLRYEIFFPRTESFNNFSGFDPTVPNPAAGDIPGAIAFLGDGPGRNGRTSFADTWYKGFGPRFGFAYSLTPKTVLRGGYGIAYAAGNATAGLRSSQRFGFGFNYQPTFRAPTSASHPG